MENSKDRNGYVDKLKIAGIQICPYEIQEDDWLDDHLQWPSVEFGNVFMFLLDSSVEYTLDTLKSYKSLEAYKCFEEGLVQNIKIFKPPTSNNVVFRAKIDTDGEASKLITPWIAVSEMGTVSAGHCDCTHGYTKPCVHVAALLFKIEEVIRYRDMEKYRQILNLDTPKCSCEECEYHDSLGEGMNEEELCKPISEIEFFKPKSKKSKKKKQTQIEIPEPTHAEKYKFLHEIYKSCPNAVIFTAFPPGAFKDPVPNPNLKL